MGQKIIVKAHADHIDQWLYFKRLFVRLRKSDADGSGKAVPRATNDDVAQLAAYWTFELERTRLRSMFSPDRSRRSRDRWTRYAEGIAAHVQASERLDVFPHNERFWQVETARLAQYLNSLTAVPTHAQLIVESITEAAAESAAKLAAATRDAVDTVDDSLGALKRGAIVIGGVVGAAVLVPIVLRATRRNG